MTENEFLLEDRLTKIKSVIDKYGEENFHLSFSGGKDSTVLSALLDMACPGNKIPRVYANTGIEYRLILEFVEREKAKDHPWELVVLQPKKNIKQMLEEDGYPFKSKMHSNYVKKYQDKGFDYKSVRAYTGKETTLSGRPMFRPCPKILAYQFTDENKLKISDLCCLRLKKEPLDNWLKESGKKYAIVGVMREEGGRRKNAQCLSLKGGKLWHFQPLAPITKEWEDWFIEEYNIDIADLYKPPYNFERTGCKGCPFALNLQHELDTLEKFFPAERKQCEIIWKPVYDEYRRLGYRLKKEEQKQMEITDFID